MSWNWAYSKRKQKEMAEKSADYQKSNDTYKYTEFSKPQQSTTKWREEREKEHRMKIITVTLLTLYSIFCIGVITYFMVYGV